MQSLAGDFKDQNGILLLGNEAVEVYMEKDFFKVLIKDNNNDIEFFICTKVIINCLGINALAFSNKLYGFERYKLRLLKGDYYSYSGKEKLRHLIYPIPSDDSLGTHATIDLGEGIRFGPSAYEVQDENYEISVNEKFHFLRSIRKYWPSVTEDNIMPSYSGIRPLIKDCDDFLIEKGMFDGNILVDILGYASPGLTSSLATANYVRKLLDEF